jgi:peptide chain release factor 2
LKIESQNSENVYHVIWSVFEIFAKQKEIKRLGKESSLPSFWNDTDSARSVMRRLGSLNKQVEEWLGMEAKALELFELAQLSAEDRSLNSELESEVTALISKIEQAEFNLSLNGPYDNRNAILAIHAGAGGVESMDWAQMLLNMYLKWAENHGFQTEILDSSVGEEAGIKSAVVQINGEYAFGYLKSEHGVHRLIRLSPFDTDHARHTSFALVEVMPEAEGEIDIHIDPDDLKIDAFRSSGPGGQNVQKVSSAVRITHIPSGIVVASQTERSQLQNKDTAMRILRSRLFQEEIERRAEERARIKGERISAEWGSQIRSYTLHPYRLVKDHRTGYETNNAEAVLGGDIDDFIQAFLRSGIGREEEQDVSENY